MAKAKVAVLGAGFAGLETAFYLRHTLHDKVDLTLVSDRDYFLFKPNTIYIPFGEDPEKFKIQLDEPVRRKNLTFIQDSVQGIEPDGKVFFCAKASSVMTISSSLPGLTCDRRKFRA